MIEDDPIKRFPYVCCSCRAAEIWEGQFGSSEGESRREAHLPGERDLGKTGALSHHLLSEGESTITS